MSIRHTLDTNACYWTRVFTQKHAHTYMYTHTHTHTAGWTPLMYASYVGHDTIVNLLLDSGAEPTRGTPSSLTPLMVAAGCGNESVCYFLIQVCVCVCVHVGGGVCLHVCRSIRANVSMCSYV